MFSPAFPRPFSLPENHFIARSETVAKLNGPKAWFSREFRAPNFLSTRVLFLRAQKNHIFSRKNQHFLKTPRASHAKLSSSPLVFPEKNANSQPRNFLFVCALRSEREHE
jgi:hypothetical protein